MLSTDPGKWIWPNIILAVLFLCMPVFACTVVSVKANGLLLVGNNEDASPSYPARVIFRKPEDGLYGYAIFGFADGWPQGGMNDQGLVFGGAAGYSTEWRHDPEKADYRDNLSIKIMTECASVEEALHVFETYNNPDLEYSRVLLADRQGESVIIWYDTSMRMTRRT